MEHSGSLSNPSSPITSEFTIERIYDMEMFLIARLVKKDCSVNKEMIGSCMASIVVQKTDHLLYSAADKKPAGPQCIKIELSTRTLLNFSIIYNDWANAKRGLQPKPDEHEPAAGPKKKLECAECNKVLSSKSSLNLHKRVHTGEKPHKCKVCGEVFRWYTSFKRHVAVHKSHVRQGGLATKEEGGMKEELLL